MGLPVIPEGTSGSGLARICGRTHWPNRRFNAKDAENAKSLGGISFNWPCAFLAVLALTNPAVVEVAHSSAALALALCRAGPGFPSRFVESGIRSFFV
jgi:hypothetical protein